MNRMSVNDRVRIIMRPSCTGAILHVHDAHGLFYQVHWKNWDVDMTDSRYPEEIELIPAEAPWPGV